MEASWLAVSTISRAGGPDVGITGAGDKAMILSRSVADGCLPEDQVRQIVGQAAAELQVAGKRVLTIIPDGTRTMPMPLMFQLLQQEIGTTAAACDYLVALGTHPLMSDAA